MGHHNGLFQTKAKLDATPYKTEYFECGIMVLRTKKITWTTNCDILLAGVSLNAGQQKGWFERVSKANVELVARRVKPCGGRVLLYLKNLPPVHQAIGPHRREHVNHRS